MFIIYVTTDTGINLHYLIIQMTCQNSNTIYHMLQFASSSLNNSFFSNQKGLRCGWYKPLWNRENLEKKFKKLLT